MNHLRTEAHLHLYGCLSAEDLWHIGRERFRKQSDRLTWYANEYERVTGRRPAYEDYWTKDNGLELMRQDFLFTDAAPFPEFQAKFNLLIALCPANPDDLTLAEHVFRSHEVVGGTKEYRTFLPHYLSSGDRSQFLKNMLSLAKEHTSSTYKPLIALSFVRTAPEAGQLYEFLFKFRMEHPDLAPLITGIDFCGSEVGFPPGRQRPFFDRVKQDRKNKIHDLEILYHVGEMWDHISLGSAARWVAEAVFYGVRRVGHGMALGLDPEALRGTTSQEPRAEAEYHLKWLAEHQAELAQHGFTHDHRQWLQARMDACTGDLVTWEYNDDLLANTRALQDALIPMVHKQSPVIEVCPTSNLRIGQVPSPRHHPLRRFLDVGLRVAVATDDPGIFAITLETEEALLRREFWCSDDEISKFENDAKALLDLSSP